MTDCLTGTGDPGDPALIADDGATITYGQLADLVDRACAVLPVDVKLLVHLPFHRTTGCIIAYLAALKTGHAVLLTAPDPGQYEPVTDRYPADVTVTADGCFLLGDGSGEITADCAVTPHHDIHPDTAVLMSTSGTTGSQKLVRLTGTNIVANATGIVQALGITAADRSLTVLPPHYSFGLSVVNTHLLAGASLVVGNYGVTDPEFFTRVRQLGVTNFGAVPHMLDLLRATAPLPAAAGALRLIYQAGGKLDRHKTVAWAGDCDRLGIDFRVMYGQTEATARMTVMKKGCAATHPDAAGYVLDGCSMTVRDPAPDGTGELVFEGPNVMMGYAHTPQDLALGVMIDHLDTGDVGTVDDDGLVTITGRKADFVKIAGLRIELHRLQEMLSEKGINSLVTGDDSGVRVLVEKQTSVTDGSAGPAAVRKFLVDHTGIDAGHISVAATGVLPRLANEKPDRATADRMVAQITGQAEKAEQQQVASPEKRVAGQLERILGVDGIDFNKSFAANGGTSLNQVAAAAALTKVCGTLPVGWANEPLSTLLPDTHVRMAPWKAVWIDSPVIIRMVAAFTIVASHASVMDVTGGAHSLLMVAGFALGMFTLSKTSRTQRLSSVLRTIVSVAVPASIVATLGVLFTGTYGLSNALLIHWLWEFPGSQRHLWFIEAYMWDLGLIAGVFCIPPVVGSYRRHPFATSLALLAVAIGFRYALAFDVDILRWDPAGVLWLVLLGLAVLNADRYPKKLLVVAVFAVVSRDYFWTEQQRFYVFVVLLVLLFVPRLPVPRILLTPVTLMSSATLYIYLVQFDVLAVLSYGWPTVMVSIPLGVVVSLAVNRVQARYSSTVVRRSQKPQRFLRAHTTSSTAD
ncbi:AMP-binding protein [Corynebacterium mendelii]|uniref:AMP-binding protein n=1 Tax=Corynebacterium mendelii TaxID=2765362 RepID=A0A939E219_9CORY|nr:AMP-binding protein [Corynebacterium mendelii]